VNEHNDQAVGFYRQLGYELIGRQEMDSLGRPFPILHMRFNHHAKKASISKSQKPRKNQIAIVK